MSPTMLVGFAALVAACGTEDQTPLPPTSPPAVLVPEAAEPATPVRGPTCSYHGLCWSNPSPQGNSLRGVWAARPGLAYAVGERGTVLRIEDGVPAIEDAPTRELLHDVWGADEAHILAVGEAGTIISLGEEGWTLAPSQTEAALHALWGVSADLVYAVGADGTALRWDGSSWSVEDVPTELSLSDVWGSDDGSKVYALGVEGSAGSHHAVVFVRDESGWIEARDITEDVATFFLDDAGLPYLLGADGRPENSSRRVDLDITRPVNAVWAAAADDAFAVAYEGQITRFTNGSWSEMQSPERGDLLAVSGTSTTDVWAVGSDGLVLHWDGSSWTRTGGGLTAHLKAIWGLNARNVWVVGDHATLHWDGSTWSAAGPTEHDLRALWGAGDTLIAVGDGGALYRHIGGSWQADHQSSEYELNALYGADEAHLFAVGKSTWVEHEDGAWVEHSDRPTAAGVWGTGRDDVWVAGGEGVHHWDGASWTRAPNTADMTLFGVWGTAANDVWAVGAEGRILHYDGTTWSEEGAPTSQSLLSVWGRSADDVWAVGDHGTVLHFDGNQWRWRDSGTDHVLHAVWGTAERVWVVGHGGAILRFEG